MLPAGFEGLTPKAIAKDITSGAVAAKYGCLIFRPAVSKVLQIRRVLLTGMAAAQELTLLRLTGPQVTSLLLTQQGNLNAIVTDSRDIGAMSATECITGVSAVGVSTPNLPGSIALPSVNAGDTLAILFDDPLLIWGNDAGGPGAAFAVLSHGVANVAVRASITGLEWPIPT